MSMYDDQQPPIQPPIMPLGRPAAAARPCQGAEGRGWVLRGDQLASRVPESRVRYVRVGYGLRVRVPVRGRRGLASPLPPAPIDVTRVSVVRPRAVRVGVGHTNSGPIQAERRCG